MAPFFFFWLGRYRGHGPLLLINRALAVGAGHARDGGWARLLVVGSRSGRWSVRGGVPTLERGDDPTQIALRIPCRGVGAGPAGRVVRGRTGLRGRKQPFGAEPVGGVRNREKGASCLSAASSCPAGSAARRPGSSQRQGCPFFWFFSLGRQRKERLPARGRRHSGDAGAWRQSNARDVLIVRTPPPRM